MAKILFFDLETTGTRFWKDGIHQISGIVDIDGDIRKEFDFKVRPNPKCEISDEALAVSGVTREQIMAYPDMQHVYTELTGLLCEFVDKFNKADKFHLCGYNNRGFDDPFLRAWFVQNNDQYFGSWFWSDSIDVMVLACNHLINERPSMIDFKLKTVCRRVGIEIDEARLHDATYDIMLTRALYYTVKNGINGNLKHRPDNLQGRIT